MPCSVESRLREHTALLLTLPLRCPRGFAPSHSIERAILDLREAFHAGAVPDAMTDPMYYNIKRMQELRLQ